MFAQFKKQVVFLYEMDNMSWVAYIIVWHAIKCKLLLLKRKKRLLSCSIAIDDISSDFRGMRDSIDVVFDWVSEAIRPLIAHIHHSLPPPQKIKKAFDSKKALQRPSLKPNRNPARPDFFLNYSSFIINQAPPPAHTAEYRASKPAGCRHHWNILFL